VSLTLPLALALLAGDTLGVEYRGVDGNTRISIPRVEASVQVDGILDEPVWRQAARLTAFSQYTPDDGRPAEYDTEVLVWYSPGAIHFGIRATQPAGTVKATLAVATRSPATIWWRFSRHLQRRRQARSSASIRSAWRRRRVLGRRARARNGGRARGHRSQSDYVHVEGAAHRVGV
jgi:hypothetical protein